MSSNYLHNQKLNCSRSSNFTKTLSEVLTPGNQDKYPIKNKIDKEYPYDSNYLNERPIIIKKIRTFNERYKVTKNFSQRYSHKQQSHHCNLIR